MRVADNDGLAGSPARLLRLPRTADQAPSPAETSGGEYENPNPQTEAHPLAAAEERLFRSAPSRRIFDSRLRCPKTAPPIVAQNIARRAFVRDARTLQLHWRHVPRL